MKTHEEMQEMCELVITAGAMKMISCSDRELAHRIRCRLETHDSCTKSALWCDLAARALDDIISVIAVRTAEVTAKMIDQELGETGDV